MIAINSESAIDIIGIPTLATIVGTRTAGEVLGAVNFLFGEDYRLRIPIGGWMSWDDRLLAGRGVQPDVEVVPTANDLRAGKDLALSEGARLVDR